MFPIYTSFGQSGNFVTIIDENTTSSSNITGNTSNNVVYSVLIPANTFSVGKEFNFFARFVSDTTIAQKNFRAYINDTDDLTTPNLIANHTAGNTILSSDMSRRVSIKSATVTEVFNTANSTTSGDQASTAAVTQHNIDWTINQYFILAIQLTNNGDTCRLSTSKIIA